MILWNTLKKLFVYLDSFPEFNSIKNIIPKIYAVIRVNEILKQVHYETL
jgi:hypothetical protein